MFIDPLRSGSALRQEGHVDVAKPLLPRPRSNRLMLNHLYFVHFNHTIETPLVVIAQDKGE